MDKTSGAYRFRCGRGGGRGDARDWRGRSRRGRGVHPLRRRRGGFGGNRGRGGNFGRGWGRRGRRHRSLRGGRRGGRRRGSLRRRRGRRGGRRGSLRRGRGGRGGGRGSLRRRRGRGSRRRRLDDRGHGVERARQHRVVLSLERLDGGVDGCELVVEFARADDETAMRTRRSRRSRRCPLLLPRFGGDARRRGHERRAGSHRS